MNRKPLIKGVLRLFAVSVMLTALFALAPSREVKATPDYCIQNYGVCLYACAAFYPPGSLEQEQCEAQCDLYYSGCSDDPDPLPAPYPVIDHSRSWCLQGCLQCNNLADFEHRFACYDACWNWCDQNYPKP